MTERLSEQLNELLKDPPVHWYVTQHRFEFDILCRCVELLLDWKINNQGKNVHDYFDSKPGYPTHRCLNNARFFGLLTKQAATYDKEDATSVYYEIKDRTNGEFEKKELYQDIIDRQLEKYFYKSPIDDKSAEVNSDYKIFPIAFLLKILLEIGLRTGDYSISYNEYLCFLTTKKEYTDYMDSVNLILDAREDPNINDYYNKVYRESKIDERTINIVQQLSYIIYEDNRISIRPDCLEEIYKKIQYYELHNHNKYNYENYLDFLYSEQSLFGSKEINKKMKTEVKANEKAPSNFEPKQIIFYGVPGAGKSFTINEILDTEKIKLINSKRVVFHPEYTNSDFIGQILPKQTSKGIEYKFTPGPFTQILRKAYQHPEINYALIIEEINRGNAAAIFGELFQLLDRLDVDDPTNYNGVNYTKGWSSYGVDNDNINAYLLGNFDTEYTEDTTEICINFNMNSAIRIPANLSIFATMNTSDQNVFTLDNAFQRRWKMRIIQNSFNLSDKSSKEYIQATSIIENTPYEWKAFIETVNDIIQNDAIEQDLTSMEDKQIGTWFVKNTNGIITRKDFANKVLKYIWDDALKFNREKIFNKKDFLSLSQIIDYVEDDSNDIGVIFTNGIHDSIIAANLKEDTVKNSESRQGKRISFEEINIKKDDELKFHYKDKDYTCKVIDNTRVLYNDIEYDTLSKLTRDIMGRTQSPGKVSEVWYFNGKSLAELQKEL